MFCMFRALKYSTNVSWVLAKVNISGRGLGKGGFLLQYVNFLGGEGQYPVVTTLALTF